MINLNEKVKEREIRIFVSSTFKDMMSERDHLVKKVFPKLRKLCQERGVELTEVDLRWGVTEEQAEQGRVIEVCLREIDRCRPYFIGILGERYGWVPGPEEYEKHRKIIEDFPWVKKDIDEQMSITEMEIQYGVLRNPQMKAQAFFYLRDSLSTPEDFREKKGSVAAKKLLELKAFLKSKPDFPCKDFINNTELEKEITDDFTKFLDSEFPVGEKPSPLEQSRMDHAAFAITRMRVYIGSDKYFKRLDEHMISNDPPLIITGESGLGKSALLANWIAHYQNEHPNDFVMYHFIGGAPDSTDHYAMMRRIMEEMKDRFDLQDEIPAEHEKIAEAFPMFLAQTPHMQRWVLVIDALNQLEEKDNARWLGWLPAFIPENIRVIVSTLPGQAMDELNKRNYPEMKVFPLDLEGRKHLIRNYLKFFARELAEDQVEKIAKDPDSENPLILKTILDELIIFGIYEKLNERIEYYLTPKTPIEFFNAVLERLEEDYEIKEYPGMVGEILSLIWAARKGLSESELLEITNIPPLFWAPLYHAIENHLVNRAGFLDFFHDYIKQAVENKYLDTDEKKKQAHITLACYFEKDHLSDRALDELPHQLMKAKEWERLKNYICDLEVFEKLYTDQKKYELLGYWNTIGMRYDIVSVYHESLEQFERNEVY